MEQSETHVKGVGRPAAVGTEAEADSDGGVRAVERALNVLQAFATNPSRLSVTEIAAAAGLNKSTTHRLLKTLERADFVAQDPATKLYRLGLGISALGYLALDTLEVAEVARPYIAALHRRCGETIHLGLFEESDIIYVGKVESPNRPVRLNSRIGKRAPLHCTGLGKAILASLDHERAMAAIGARGLQRFTATTITSFEALQEEMALTRDRGYAIDNGEHNELVRCVAAPIFDHTGEVKAAISITTVAIDIQSYRIKELGELVRQSANEISVALGHGIENVVARKP